MFKHILIPVDGSGTSGLALAKAVGLARAFGAAATVVYVIDPYPFTGIGTEAAFGQAQYLTAAKAESAEAITAARHAFDAAGLAVDTRVVEGHTVWQGILDTAAAVGADLLVMGSHGRRGLEKLVLGSTTQRVLSHTSLPVLVVRD
jgi:nucleotide-binding universal stress UspA family protein